MEIKQHTLKQLMDQISYKENERGPWPMGYNKSNAESKVYSYKHVYLKRSQANNLTLYLK